MANKSNPTTNLSGSNYVIVMLLATLLIIGISVLIGKSLVSSVALNTKVLAKKGAAITQLNTDIAHAPALVSAYHELGSPSTAGSAAKLLNDALPATPDFPDLIASLENMANSSSVTLRSVAPDTSLLADSSSVPAQSTDSFTTAPQEYSVDVDFEGSYTSIQKFLAAIENSARPMQIATTQIAGTGSDLTGTFTIVTYYQAAASLPFKMETVK